MNIETMKHRHDADKAFRQSQASTIAKTIWDCADPAKANHAYLRKRGIRPHGTRVIKDSLIVPVTDRGWMISLQYIHTNGTARFMPNGRTKGGYYVIGRPKDADTLCLTESFSTGASIHEATGYPVVVFFYADNLTRVVRAMKEIYPFKTLLVCPDGENQVSGCHVIQADPMTMARQIKRLASPEAKQCQAHLLCQSLVAMLRRP